MSDRILFVDDDPALLGTLQRNLCFNYDLVTAESGADALARIAEEGPFAVIVTDMRMPHMDGISFIDKARRISPDSIYLMLTGNQDVETALKAVNDGQVFRFLNKPCETADLRKAVDAALRQRQMIQAERELLQKTFVGAVNLMTDVVNTLSPAVLGESQQVDSVMQQCEAALGVEGDWEYRLASRISLLGVVLLPGADQMAFQAVSPAKPECQQVLERAAAATARLIRHIPRLENLAKIIHLHADANGAALAQPVVAHDPAVPATLLRVAVHWVVMLQQGMTPAAALEELHLAMPKLPKTLDETLLTICDEHPQREHVEVQLHKLQEDMVLYENVLSDDGAVLLRAGRRLTAAIIEKLRLHSGGGRRVRPIRVVKSSVRAEALACL